MLAFSNKTIYILVNILFLAIFRFAIIKAEVLSPVYLGSVEKIYFNEKNLNKGIAESKSEYSNLSPQHAIKVYNKEHGLPYDQVFDIKFDKKGYLWVAMPSHLARYDGISWSEIALPLPNILWIDSIVPSIDGGLWVVCQKKGIFKYRDGLWTIFTEKEGIPFLDFYTATEIVDKNGKPTLWVGLIANGLLFFNNGNWGAIGKKQGYLGGRINKIHSIDRSDYKTELWLATSNGLLKYSYEKYAKNGNWEIYNSKNSQLPDDNVNSVDIISFENRRTILVATNNGIAFIEKKQIDKDYWRIFGLNDGLPDLVTKSILATKQTDGSYYIWAGFSNSKLSYWDGLIWKNIDSRNGFTDTAGSINLITTKDKNIPHDTIWIGTDNDGLFRLHQHGWKSLKAYHASLGKSIWSIKSTPSYLNHENKKTKEVEYFIATNEGLIAGQNENWYQYSIPQNENSKKVRSISLMPNENNPALYDIWLSNKADLIQISEEKAYKWDLRTLYKNIKTISTINTFKHLDGRSSLWISDSHGNIFIYDKKNWDMITIPGGKKHAIISMAMFIDKNGKETVFVGSDDGLWFYSDKTWVTITEKNGLSGRTIRNISIIKADKYYVWFATNTGPLWYDPSENGILLHKLPENFLQLFPSLVIQSIILGSDGYYYFSTESGIIKLRPHSYPLNDKNIFSARLYTTEDGLPSADSNPSTLYADEAGTIWIGTTKGVAFFNTKYETIDKNNNLYLENIHINKKPISIFDLKSKFLNLEYKNRNITFEYTYPNFFHEKQIMYRTKLDGLDEKSSLWSYNNTKEYNILPPGEYKFNVWVRDGITYQELGPLSYGFKVGYPWWRHTFAYISYSFALTGLVYLGIVVRTKNLQKKNLFLEQKIEERTLELSKRTKELDFNNILLLKQTEELNNSNVELQRINEELNSKNIELDLKNIELIKSKEDLLTSYKQADLIFSALADVLPGTILDNKYRLDEKIGSGGFGIVYGSTHLLLHKKVAIKIFKPNQANAKIENLKRFQREAISLCQINHVNAVNVLDSGISSSGVAYIVMERLYGRSLSDELESVGGKLPPNRCLEILRPICKVLQHAHELGIVHRDIKPDNIFLHYADGHEIIKVLDFGVAKLLNKDINDINPELTNVGEFIGTPLYMAPELFNQIGFDGKVDVYAIGVMLYKFISGREPFILSAGSSVAKLILDHISTEPISLSTLVSNMDAALEDTVLSALEKKPYLRPDITDFYSSLEEAVPMCKNGDAIYVSYREFLSFDLTSQSQNIDKTMDLEANLDSSTLHVSLKDITYI